MKPSPAAAAAAAAKEPEPGQAAVAVAAPREPDARWREKGEAEAERQRTRERLEATLAGLGELDYLRQRQELLVKSLLLSHRPGAAPSAAGPRGEPPGEGDAQRSLEEKFLEENILLLRRQLNCLRRRDAGLLSQLQELDKQISDLRLDVEKTTDERLETDSRPSSGFYELSDGASGSLSNSSNSVFSECLSSCHSSTCFCSPLETSLNSSDGRPKSTDLIDWMDYNKEGQHEDLAAGAGCRSLSTPHSNSLDVVADVHPKYQCDLVSKNGNDVYRYPSPLHAVAVQSPMFLLPVTGNPPREEERRGCNVNDVCIGAEPDSVKAGNSLLPQSSWSGACPSANKKIDGYILSLVQKKTHSVRTNKPRTNLNADPTKGILRHGSMCVRQAAAVSPTNVVNLKNSKQACLPTGGTAALDTSTFSPLNQRSKEANGEQLESRKMSTTGAYPPSTVNELQSKHPSRNGKSASQEPTWGPVATAGDVLKEKGQLFAASPKESSGWQTTLQLENKVPPPPKKILLRNTLQAAQPTVLPHEERPTLDFKSEGSSSQSLDEGGLLVSAQYIPAQHQSLKLHKSTRSVKVLKSSTLKHRSHLASLLETSAPTGREKTKSAGKKCRFRDDVDTNKKLKKPSGRGKRSSSSQLEPSQPSRQPGLHKSGIRSHGHGREVVVAKPKHKRGDYRRWKSSAEVSYEEALRRARRNRREAVSVYPQVPSPYVSPYAYIASDSEYSAECESLFHSTVVDTSEDERSNYTTNCFGDSESSLSEVEFVGESTTTSDSDESGGLIWSQFVQTLPIQTVAAPELQENAAKAFVKIKASHNLKKKILRFRSGSLKLMTTV